MTRTTIVFALATVAACLAGAGDKVYLWPVGKMPDAQPHQIAAMTDVAGKKDFNPDEWRRPYIEWEEAPKAEVKTDACVILISGGAYQNQCDVGLVRSWARDLTALGVTCVNLVHRTPRPKDLPIHQSAWEDGQRAVRLVRSEAEKRGFNPERIGVFSMSAGSHLATLLATSSQTNAYEAVDELDAIPCHINWACTFAIAYGMTDGIGHPNKQGGDAEGVILDPIFRFDSKTCPMCMMHGGKDPYSPMTSTHVYRRLRSMKIPAEVHLYPDKGHGAFGFQRAVEFMRQMGYLPQVEKKQVTLMSRFPNDDARAEYAKESIWPEGKMPDVQTNQCLPYIEWHMPKELKTKAIQIIFSGGAYSFNTPDGFEVAPARRYLNQKGMTVVTLKYRTPRPAAPLPKHAMAWEDLQRAVRIVRSEAEARGLDPNRIGVMGSSAGGHLGLLGVVSSMRNAYAPIDDIDKTPCNVQWAVLFYPAYILTDGLNGGNSNGGNDDSAQLAPEFDFDEATAPVLFLHGDADGYASMNSVKAWERMRRMGVQGEVHTFATRNHCFQSQALPGTGSYTCLDRIWEFLSTKGFNK